MVSLNRGKAKRSTRIRVKAQEVLRPGITAPKHTHTDSAESQLPKQSSTTSYLSFGSQIS